MKYLGAFLLIATSVLCEKNAFYPVQCPNSEDACIYNNQLYIAKSTTGPVCWSKYYDIGWLCTVRSPGGFCDPNQGQIDISGCFSPQPPPPPRPRCPNRFERCQDQYGRFHFAYSWIAPKCWIKDNFGWACRTPGYYGQCFGEEINIWKCRRPSPWVINGQSEAPGSNNDAGELTEYEGSSEAKPDITAYQKSEKP